MWQRRRCVGRWSSLVRDDVSSHHSRTLDGTSRDSYVDFRTNSDPSRSPDPSTCPQATGKFLTEVEGLQLVFGWDEVEARWYKLATVLEAIAVPTPNIVPIVPFFDEAAVYKVWPLRSRRVPRYPPSAHRPISSDGQALGDAEETGEGVDSDADEAMVEAEDLFDLEQELSTMLEAADVIAEDGLGGAYAEQAAGSGAIVLGAAPAPDAGEGPQSPPADAGPVAPASANDPPVPVGQRGAAVAVCQTIGGSIAFYGSKSAFEAVCDHPAHGRCVATRTNKGRGKTAEGFPRGGRPVGFLAAWLQTGGAAATKDEHWAMFENSQHERAALRAAIGATEAGATLLQHERPVAAGEPQEPPSCEGYLPR